MLLKTYIFARDGLEAFSCTNENVVKVLKFIAILFDFQSVAKRIARKECSKGNPNLLNRK